MKITRGTPPEPFPIADYVEGLSLEKEPWISPSNAFRRLEDSRVFRGRLTKRSGYSRLAEITNNDADVSTAALSAIDVTYTPNPITARAVPESVRCEYDNGASPAIYAVLDLNSERWLGADSTEIANASPYSFGPTRDGGLAYHAEEWCWDVIEEGGTKIIGKAFYHPAGDYYGSGSGQQMVVVVEWDQHTDYDFQDASRMAHRTTYQSDVVGLTRFRTTDNEYTVAFSEDWLYEYDPSLKYFKIQGKGSSYATPYLTGDSEDYVWTYPADDFLLFTNGKDPLHKWTPTVADNNAVAEMATAWDGGGNELDTCRLAFIFGGRMIAINTTESATKYPGRLRYSDVASYETYGSALDFIDAPSALGEAVTGGFIGEQLFIGFEEGWAEVVQTGNPNAPFEWRPLISRFGAVSKLSTIEDNERLLSRSETTMQGIDPNAQYYIDENIPDYVREFSADKTELSAAARNEEQRAFWWTYVDANDSAPNNVLSATYDEKNMLSWSVYDLTMRVFSTFDSEQTPTWNSLGPATWNDYSGTTWNDARIGIAGFTQLIAGSTRGMIYVFNTASRDFDDQGALNIEMLAQTQRLSFYPGQRSTLAWLDIYADGVTGQSVTVSFYADQSSASYLTKDIDLTPNTASGKVWRRITVNYTSQFHTIRIVNTGSTAISIDAIVPYAKAAGRARPFN